MSLFLQADSMNNDHTFKEGIAEVYELTGEKENLGNCERNSYSYERTF